MGMSEEQIDVEGVIAEFVNDGARASLELPPMLASQRKHVKAIAETYPNLECQSFGMQMERCIHLFKKDSGKEAGSVSVKNTFIDDWITPSGDDDSVEPVVFRSMPSQLSESPARLAASAGTTSKLDLSPISEGSPKLSRADSFSMGCWKQADQAAASPGNTGRRDVPGLPTLLGNFQVRNTFIHIDDMSPDGRSIQSMPHDMFRQCLEEEMFQLGEGSESDAQIPAEPAHDGVWPVSSYFQTAPASAPSSPDKILPGTQVIIQGLTKIPAFNGQSGIIERLDEVTGRYSVKLTTGGPGIPKFAKVKGDNLCVATPLPPPLPFAPTCTVTSSGPQAYFGAFGDTSATRLKLTALV